MKNTLSFLTLLCIIFFGCSDDSVINPIGDYTTILFTDEFGNVIGGDTTDWCYKSCSDSLSSCDRLFPAYPNPVNDTVNFRFDVKSNNSLVKLYFFNSSDTVFLVNQNLQSGSYQIWISKYTFGLSNIYKRIYIQINNFYCFGDVKFN